MSQMMVAVFSLLCFFILSVCAALVTIKCNSCYLIVNFFRPSGSSELLLYCWYAALFVVHNGICV